jgi:hypothetical protein
MQKKYHESFTHYFEYDEPKNMYLLCLSLKYYLP